jgi:hypothetical protein
MASSWLLCCWPGSVGPCFGIEMSTSRQACLQHSFWSCAQLERGEEVTNRFGRLRRWSCGFGWGHYDDFYVVDLRGKLFRMFFVLMRGCGSVCWSALWAAVTSGHFASIMG